MKALSAVSIRLYQQALAALEQSRRTVEFGLCMVLTREPDLLAALESMPVGSAARRPAAPPEVIVLLGADRGMCGPFNEHVVAHAVEILHPATAAPPLVLAVGHRLERPCEAAGIPIAAREVMPASPRGMTSTAEAILVHYDGWRERDGAAGLVVVHNRPLATTGYVAHSARLFPPNPRWLRRIARQPWPTRNIPMSPSPARELFPALIRQHLLLSLHQSLAESLASEHAARLVAMQVAERNVEDHRTRLQNDFHRRRQQALDEELLDLVSGYLALTKA
jgi:F-type H+-transporting ATPase subunit gamma